MVLGVNDVKMWWLCVSFEFLKRGRWNVSRVKTIKLLPSFIRTNMVLQPNHWRQQLFKCAHLWNVYTGPTSQLWWWRQAGWRLGKASSWPQTETRPVRLWWTSWRFVTSEHVLKGSCLFCLLKANWEVMPKSWWLHCSLEATPTTWKVAVVHVTPFRKMKPPICLRLLFSWLSGCWLGLCCRIERLDLQERPWWWKSSWRERKCLWVPLTRRFTHVDVVYLNVWGLSRSVCVSPTARLWLRCLQRRTTSGFRMVTWVQIQVAWGRTAPPLR